MTFSAHIISEQFIIALSTLITRKKKKKKTPGNLGCHSREGGKYRIYGRVYQRETIEKLVVQKKKKKNLMKISPKYRHVGVEIAKK